MRRRHGLVLVARRPSAAHPPPAAPVHTRIGSKIGFEGALRTLVPLAQPAQRAGLLSAVFLASYVALGVPAIVAGVLVTRAGLVATAHTYATVVILLASVSLIATSLRRFLGGRRRPVVTAQESLASE